MQHFDKHLQLFTKLYLRESGVLWSQLVFTLSNWTRWDGKMTKLFADFLPHLTLLCLFNMVWFVWMFPPIVWSLRLVAVCWVVNLQKHSPPPFSPDKTKCKKNHQKNPFRHLKGESAPTCHPAVQPAAWFDWNNSLTTNWYKVGGVQINKKTNSSVAFRRSRTSSSCQPYPQCSYASHLLLP